MIISKLFSVQNWQKRERFVNWPQNIEIPHCEIQKVFHKKP